MLSYPLIYPLVVSAEDDEVLLKAHLVSDALIECLAIGRGIDHLVVVALAFQFRDRSVNGLDLEDHPRFAPERIIIDTAPLIRGPVSDIVYM